ncbi:MAG: hypothetical protein JKY51_05015 [Opitutaceae bacterium]|nr:hypothetical protein [Opitutaceae bacterium]
MSNPSAKSSISGSKPVGKPTVALTIGVIALLITSIGFFMYPKEVASSWLLASAYSTAIGLGLLLMVMLHHIFDAGWSTVIRRTLEHSLAIFPWLALFFLPLIILSYFEPSLIWKWMDPHFDLSTIGGHGTVGSDILYVKKSALLNFPTFVIIYLVSFVSWIWLSSRFRKASFTQDEDGSGAHTTTCRKMAALGIPVVAFSSTLIACLWLKSLDYHWFSTMYGVWFFTGAMRAALATIALICIFLSRNALKGLFLRSHMLQLGNMMLAFTVFWAYISFSQYFLIWNANIPEETFWYVIREHGNWRYVGYTLIFAHFFFPLFFLLGHRNKLIKGRMIFICVWVLLTQLLDFYYNILPYKKDGEGNPFEFGVSVWDVTALIGIGGICIWAFLRSFNKTRPIPIRDPRILESLNYHE